MLQNQHESGDPNRVKNENDIIKKDATDPLSAKHILCRLCRLPKIGSNQVRPNGLRGCQCDELFPYYNTLLPYINLNIFYPLYNSSNFPSTNLDSHGLVSHYPQKMSHAQLPEIINVATNLDSSKNERCSAEAEPPKERSFVPPQGMDTGLLQSSIVVMKQPPARQYPTALFYQYYQNRNGVHTFDLLPLPFMDRLRYQEMCALSIDNLDIKEKWKDFLHKLPNSELELPAYPDDRFWRWRQYLRYAPDEIKNEFRYKMQTGPKYDGVGRLPITGEELNIFRGIKTKPKPNRNIF